MSADRLFRIGIFAAALRLLAPRGFHPLGRSISAAGRIRPKKNSVVFLAPPGRPRSHTEEADHELAGTTDELDAPKRAPDADPTGSVAAVRIRTRINRPATDSEVPTLDLADTQRSPRLTPHSFGAAPHSFGAAPHPFGAAPHPFHADPFGTAAVAEPSLADSVLLPRDSDSDDPDSSAGVPSIHADPIFLSIHTDPTASDSSLHSDASAGDPSLHTDAVSGTNDADPHSDSDSAPRSQSNDHAAAHSSEPRDSDTA